MALKTLTIDINANLASLKKDFEEAVRISRQGTDAIKKSFEDLQHTLEKIGLGVGLVELFDQLIDKNLEFEKSQNSLQSALRATGYAAGLTADDLEAMGKAFTSSTNFDSEDIRNAETALLRFRGIQRDVFQDALKATLDLATLQGGK